MAASVTMTTRYNSVIPSKGEEVITCSMIDLADAVGLANNVGTELVANNLHEEASFHFQLAIEKVMDIHRSCGLPSDFGSRPSNCALHCDIPVIDYADIQDFSSQGKIAPPSPQTASSVEYMIWLKCASLVALRNSILVKTRMGLRRDANKILDCATRMLDEIDEGDAVLKKLFYHDRTQHAILGMSLRMLQGERMMTMAGAISTFSERTRRTMVHEAMKHFARAVDLGRVFFTSGAKENSLVAQALSRLGYCLMMEGEESLASIVYSVASQEYSSCRQEGSDAKELFLDSDVIVVLGAAAA